ncbi:long-chain-fatty-acid--CoA ligase [Zhongshania sp. BJYM1]|uniref:long-chain-fatty-acid--CoA ligase n=1 Tax=Zhongshania aquatica TaxID=2965069 RepID=UPI0022B3E88A|nr:long-chain-fatty-acid--CoA ligase [Marortus sp. BJYM1]
MTNVSPVRSFNELIAKHAATQPNNNATIFNGRKTSYGELDKVSNRFANALLGANISKGSRVGILAKNSDTYLQLLFACAKVGAVAVGLNWRLSPAELSYIANDSDMELLFVGTEFFDGAQTVSTAAPKLKHIISLNNSHPHWPTIHDWASDVDTPPSISVSPDDAALQLYTSGTTGHPKGVVLPHRAFFDPWIYDPDPLMAWNEVSQDEVCLLAMPFFHVGGIGLCFMSLRAGCSAVIVPEFSPMEFLRLVPEHKVTRTFLVPAAIRSILLLPEASSADWSSLKLVIYGAAPMPEALLLDAFKILKCDFTQLYGMTEVCGAVVHLPPQDHIEGSTRLRAAGIPIPSTDIKIIDGAGQLVKQGAVGEILLSSPAVMQGYWKNEDATAKTLVDGYIHTGDAGYQDEDGYLYIFDRVKDMIISGGENIYPIEVENVLYSHPDISDVAVIGIPDDKWGELVAAVVVLNNGRSPTESELIDYVKTHIASYKCPKKIIFTDELPRNASGKILKRELRKPYWESLERKI